MAETHLKAAGGSARPLSPHLTICRPTITLVMSGMHRITGAALYFGMPFLAWWLIAAATGPGAFDTANAFFGSFLGRLILFGFTWALIHHMLGGIRHLIWDTGVGFDAADRIDVRLGDARRLRRADLRRLDHRVCAEMKSIRTPLAEVRGLGSAKKGTGEFVVQRVTSVALVILLTLFIVIVVALNGEPYDVVIMTLSSPVVALIMLAGVLVTVVHMRVGMQVIIEDYVHGEMLKVAALVANSLFSWGIGLIAAFALLKIAFGAV